MYHIRTYVPDNAMCELLHALQGDKVLSQEQLELTVQPFRPMANTGTLCPATNTLPFFE